MNNDAQWIGSRMAITANERTSRILLIGAFLVVYLIWGSTYLAIKYAIETLPPLLMAGTRFVLAGGILYGLMRLRGSPTLTRDNWLASGIVGCFLLVGGNGGLVWAERSLPSGLAALLIATEPLWVVLLSWSHLRQRRRRGQVLLGVLIGFSGIWFLVNPVNIAKGGLSVSSIVVLGAAASWAVGSLYALRAPLPASSLLASSMQMLVGGAVLLLVGSLKGELAHSVFTNVSARSLGAFFYLVVFGSIISFTAYNWLLRVASPTLVATYAFVNPVVAVGLGWILAGERLSIRSGIAGALIVVSVVLITFYGTREGTKVSAL